MSEHNPRKVHRAISTVDGHEYVSWENLSPQEKRRYEKIALTLSYLEDTTINETIRHIQARKTEELKN